MTVKCRKVDKIMFKVKTIKLEVKISGEIDIPDQWRTQEFCSLGGGSTNSAEDRGKRTGIWGR